MKKRTILTMAALLITGIVLTACDADTSEVYTPTPERTEAPREHDDYNPENDSDEPDFPDDEIYFPDVGDDEDLEPISFLPVTIPSAQTPSGFAGFAVYLDERQSLTSWGGEPGWFRVTDDTGRVVMSIGQFANIGMTAHEWVRDMVERFAEDDVYLTYMPPIADFPFFVMPRTVVSGEGIEGQSFIRDNERGGIFYINIILCPDDWEFGAGLSLLHSLTTFEVAG